MYKIIVFKYYLLGVCFNDILKFNAVMSYFQIKIYFYFCKFKTNISKYMPVKPFQVNIILKENDFDKKYNNLNDWKYPEILF